MLGDDRHYFRVADWLNGEGFDVLVVEYQTAVAAVPDARNGETGERIAKVTAAALEVQRDRGRIDNECGFVIGWSLGAEGVWHMIQDDVASDELVAAAVYYPAHETPVRNAVQAPVVVLQGSDDNVTPVAN